MRNGGKWKLGRELVNWVAINLDEYTEAVEDTCKPAPTIEFQSSWSPPLAHLFKVNVDGAVLSAQKAVGIGVIIRDGEGRVEAAIGKKIFAPLGAVEAEAKALEAGLLLAKDIGIQDLILEGDSIIVHRALCEMSTLPSSVEPIIEGMHAICKD